MITDRRAAQWVRMMAVWKNVSAPVHSGFVLLGEIHLQPFRFWQSDQYQFYSMLMRYNIYLQQHHGSCIRKSRNILKPSFQFPEIDFYFKKGFIFHGAVWVWPFRLKLMQYLLQQLLPQSAGLDGKLQLSVHGGDVNIDLWKDERKQRFKWWPTATGRGFPLKG